MTGFLTIGNTLLRVEISPYGAALARVWFAGHEPSLVLGLERPEDYADAPHAIGVIVGPIAGRVSGAQVLINDQRYRLEANTPPDCLHSGSEAIQHRRWDVEAHAANRLTLRCVLPDGACGLPGRRKFHATYEVSGTSLTISIATTTDADTLVNATSHAYWTLDDAGDLSTHRLTVHSQRMLDTGPDLIPTGRILEIADGPFDFSSPRDPVAGPALDGCFCLPSQDRCQMPQILHLESLRSGVDLRVASDQPGVVLYSGEHLPNRPSPPRTPPIKPFSALAIEPQAWPDAANKSQFPSIFLEKCGTLSQVSRFSVAVS